MQLSSILASVAVLSSVVADCDPAKFILSHNESATDFQDNLVGVSDDTSHFGDVLMDYGHRAFQVYLDGDKLGVTTVIGIPTGLYGSHGKLYWLVKDDGQITIGNWQSTEGFSIGDMNKIAFDGKTSFAICLDNKQIYTKEPPSCNKVQWTELVAIS